MYKCFLSDPSAPCVRCYRTRSRCQHTHCLGGQCQYACHDGYQLRRMLN